MLTINQSNMRNIRIVYLSKEKDIFNQNLCNLNWQLNEIDFKTQNVFIKTLDNELKKINF